MVKKAKTIEPANHIAVFQENTIRRVWHNEEEWWFSVVDVCAILTASPDAGAYWRKLKQRLIAEGSQPVTFCHGLKLLARDGKQRETGASRQGAEYRLWLGNLQVLDGVDSAGLAPDYVVPSSTEKSG